MRKILPLFLAAVFATSTAFAQAPTLSPEKRAQLKLELNTKMGQDAGCATVTSACLDKYGLITQKDAAGLFELSEQAVAAALAETGTLGAAGIAGMSAGTVGVVTAALVAVLAASSGGGGGSGTGTTGTTGTK